jgi:hypothetical protein
MYFNADQRFINWAAETQVIKRLGRYGGGNRSG